jgi:hypothetical protein
MREIHVLSSARISRVKVLGVFGAAAGAGDLAAGRLASSGAGGLFAEPAAGAGGAVTEDAGSVWVGVVAVEIGGSGNFSADRVPAVGADGGAETGAAD